MEINGVSSGATTASMSSLNANFDQFLRLLTTQLQNQDPLEPMDTKDFTNQLVQFSGVEQQIKTNERLEALLSTQSLNLTALGVSFIGKDVEIVGKNFSFDGTDEVPLSYLMPETATSGTITIVDEQGNTVYTKPVELTSGIHSFKWDGKDSAGQIMPAGKYEIKISALGEAGTTIKPTTYVPGFVSGLESTETGELMLNVGDQRVSIGDVRRIYQSSQNSSGT
jgi:flagellar basal-body rod modification protein FlgD